MNDTAAQKRHMGMNYERHDPEQDNALRGTFEPSRDCDECFGSGEAVGYDDFDRLAWVLCSCVLTGKPVRAL